MKVSGKLSDFFLLFRMKNISRINSCDMMGAPRYEEYKLLLLLLCTASCFLFLIDNPTVIIMLTKKKTWSSTKCCTCTGAAAAAAAAASAAAAAWEKCVKQKSNVLHSPISTSLYYLKDTFYLLRVIILLKFG